MTNKEAIEILKNEIRCVNVADTCDRDCYHCQLMKPDVEIITAMNMAIEALN